MPDLPVVQDELVLRPNDRLILHTDGLMEAMDSAGSLYGLERMAASLQGGDSLPLDEVLQKLVNGAREFQGSATFTNHPR